MTALANLFLALGLPAAGIGADAPCPAEHAHYRLNWTANMANEQNLSGIPTMAFAMSPDGPALPVEITFHGQTQYHVFGSPRVEGIGTGKMILEQRLREHDEYTTMELLFNRHVTALDMTIEGIDESNALTGPYADRILLGGANKNLEYVVEPFISRDGMSRSQNSAREDLLRSLGREKGLEILPRPADPYTHQSYSTVKAHFDQPVSFVKLTFGSDGKRFPAAHFDSRPGTQDIAISDVSFCVPYGSRVGD